MMAPKKLNEKERQAETDSGSDEREHEAFGDQQAHDTNVARTERKPKCDLSRPRDAARQQHPADVRAGDEEYRERPARRAA